MTGVQTCALPISETQVFAKIGNQKCVGVFHERLVLKPEQKISLLPDLKCVHLFEADSGKRI